MQAPETKPQHFTISGPCSSAKTETSKALAQNDDIAIISVGSFFRHIADNLSKQQIDPFDVQRGHVNEIFDRTSIDYHNNLAVPIIDQKTLSHDHKNGQNAAEYAQNKVVQEEILGYIWRLINILGSDHSYVGTEGRINGNGNTINFFLTGPTEVRTQIKRIECPDVSTLSDQEIRHHITHRDTKDFRRSEAPLRKPRDGYIIRRKSTHEEEQDSIVDFMQNTLEDNRVPKGQVLCEFDEYENSLVETGVFRGEVLYRSDHSREYMPISSA